MAEAAVTFLLEQVKEVVVGYADLIAGAEKDFEQLNNDLNLLKAFLKEMAEKQKKDDMLKVLERRIRNVVYEVEDTIDTCLTKAIDAKAKGSIRRRLSTKTFSLAKEVRDIREKLVQPLFADASNFANMKKIADGAGVGKEPSFEFKRGTQIRQNRVVGFEDEEATITGYLKERTNKLDVISIVGIPGQGKTTLAWKIYQDEKIRCHFPIRIWVNISQVFNSRDVLLQILRKFIPNQETSTLNDSELAQTVCSCLEKEKFLLVLDDIWSVEAWNIIKEVLPGNNGEGKVLITTREIDVGKKSRVYRDPHNLRFLTTEESWKLLQYEVFDNEEDSPQELWGIGYLISKKCDGVPLTIVVVGGVLSDELTKSPSTAGSEWNKVFKNVSEVLRDDKAERITDAVSLRYDRLPDDLRECFVFLGVFPEDYEISAKMLCELWISEGYVLPKKGRSVEESAEENMNDLICRNLLKVPHTTYRKRYLKTKAALVLDNKLEGGAGQNLHTLNRLAPESCTEVVSKKAKNLKTLGISGKLANIFKTNFLENLHLLEKLKMVNSVTYEQTSEDMLHALPQRNCFPPNLKRLTLTYTYLDWKHISTLAMIKNLEALKLKDNAFVGVSWNLGRDFFPELQLLLIFNTDLVLWDATHEAFPKLKFLMVKNCENLKEIPECLGTHLEKLEIERVRRSAVVSAQNIEKLQMGRSKGKFAVPFNLSIGPACETK